MTYRLRQALLATLVFLFFAIPSQAQLFGERAFLNRNFAPRQPRCQAEPRRAPTYEEYYRYMNSYYPKYYAGFHASYFQNMGIPTGDIGLRGNGIFMTPW